MPKRAFKLCAKCDSNYTYGTYCAACAPKAWAQQSKRNKQRLSGWEQQRRAARVLRNHNYVCHVCGKQGADQVDHVVPLSQGGKDNIDNLRPIHTFPCHLNKTRDESKGIA